MKETLEYVKAFRTQPGGASPGQLSLKEASLLATLSPHLKGINFLSRPSLNPEHFCVVLASILRSRGHLKCSQLKIEIME